MSQFISASLYDLQCRKGRALVQRMYLIDAEYHETNEWKFTVEGFTGTNYTVCIKPSGMSCTCPDCKVRSCICKHIYFIIFRVARAPDSVLTETTNLDSNFFENMNNFDFTASLHAQLDKRLKDDPPQLVKPEDPCCICFEDIQVSEDNETCKVCKKAFHTMCIRVWRRRNATCPLCRSRWGNHDVPTQNDVLAKYITK